MRGISVVLNIAMVGRINTNTNNVASRDSPICSCVEWVNVFLITVPAWMVWMSSNCFSTTTNSKNNSSSISSKETQFLLLRYLKLSTAETWLAGWLAELTGLRAREGRVKYTLLNILTYVDTIDVKGAGNWTRIRFWKHPKAVTGYSSLVVIQIYYISLYVHSSWSHTLTYALPLFANMLEAEPLEHGTKNAVYFFFFLSAQAARVRTY